MQKFDGQQQKKFQVEIQEKDAVVVDESGSDNKSKKGNFYLKVNKFLNESMKLLHCPKYDILGNGTTPYFHYKIS